MAYSRTEQEVRDELAFWYVERRKAATTQYSIGRRQLTRARLAEINAMIAQLEAELEAICAGKPRIRRAVPIDL